jgi:K+ transporter
MISGVERRDFMPAAGAYIGLDEFSDGGVSVRRESRQEDLSRWREQLFEWFRRNEARAVTFCRIPSSRAIEFGSQVEI